MNQENKESYERRLCVSRLYLCLLIFIFWIYGSIMTYRFGLILSILSSIICVGIVVSILYIRNEKRLSNI